MTNATPDPTDDRASGTSDLDWWDGDDSVRGVTILPEGATMEQLPDISPPPDPDDRERS
jgi:hypothetical protein